MKLIEKPVATGVKITPDNIGGYSVGDKVRVVKKVVTGEIGQYWVDAMDEKVGKKGVVTCLSRDGIAVDFKTGGRWWFDPNALELQVKTKKNRNRNGIEFPIVDEIVLYGLKDAYKVLQWCQEKQYDEFVDQDMNALEHVINYFGGNVK